MTRHYADGRPAGTYDAGGRLRIQSDGARLRYTAGGDAVVLAEGSEEPTSSSQNSDDLDQGRRTAKALAGLADGNITVNEIAPNTWSVKNGQKDPYLVVRVNQSWACDCPDWTGRCRGSGLRCKHIEAVRLASSKSPQQSPSTKETSMNEPNAVCGWTKLFHPSGVQVTVPLPLSEPLSVETAGVMFQSVTALLETGWLVNMPGLEDGERVEEIKHIVRRVKANDDATETPVVDLYPERANFRILGVYLNTPQHVQAFEAACNVRLSDLPLYEGDNSIERGKGPKTDKYVVSLPRPVKVVLKRNPRWEGDEDKKHPKRLFVRWMDAASDLSTKAPAMQAPQPAASNGKRTNGSNGHANGKNGTDVTTDALNVKLKAAREFVMPEGKTTKGKLLGSLNDATLKIIASEQYQPTSNDGKLAKEYAGLLLKHSPVPI